MQRRSRAVTARSKLSIETLEARRCLAVSVGNVGNFNDYDPFGAFREAESSGAYLYFREGQQLVRSDGTRPGTITLTNPGTTLNSHLTDANGILYFQGYDATNGFELWRSDGTVAGTALVKNLSNQPFAETISAIRPLGSRVYFVSDGDLYSTNGIAGGTVRTADVVPGASDNIRNLTVHNSALYFTAADGKLYKSNGTAAGTAAVAGAPVGDYSLMTSVPGSLYFNAGSSLWRLDDGTGRFTSMGLSASGISEANGQVFFASLGSLYKTDGLTLLEVYSGASRITSLINYQGLLYFTPQDRFRGSELFRSDGTPAGTSLFMNIETSTSGYYTDHGSDPSNLTIAAGQLYFQTRSTSGGVSPINGLWKTDGTTAGTVQLSTIVPELMVAHDDKLFFGALSRLYKLDGTNQTVEILRAGTGTASFSPNNIVDFNGQRFLFGDNGQIGTAFYRLNADDTLTLIKDLGAPADSLSAAGSVVSNGILYFALRNATRGFVNLYRTDGTAQGTQLLRTFRNVGGMVEYQNQLILAAEEDATGMELWKSDGTASGTVLIKDIGFDYGYAAVSSYPGGFTEFNNQLYFTATQFSDRRIWKTDGTNVGTQLVFDFADEYPWPSPQWLAVNQNKLYVSFSQRGTTTVYRSDGTQAGAMPLSTTFQGVGNPTVLNEQVYFPARTAALGAELWKLGGTGEPALVKDINPGTASSLSINAPIFFQSNLTAVDGKLYFAADDGVKGFELWQSDGTAANTFLTQDIRPGVGGSYPRPLGALNGVLFFAAIDGVHGDELWQTNGAARGASLVKDIAPGATSSTPMNLIISGQEALFAATTPALGTELYRARSAAPVMTLPAVAVDAFRENGPVRVAPAALLTDADNPAFLGGVLKVSLGTTHRLGDEVLLVSGASVTLNRSSVLVSGLIVGTFRVSNQGKDLTLNFNREASRANVREVLRAVAFNHRTASPVPGQRTLRFDLSDGSSAIARAGIVRVNVIPLDTLPVISGLAGSIASSLDSAGVAFAARAVVNDDNFNLAGGQLQVDFTNSRDFTRILVTLGGPTFWKDSDNNVYKGSVIIGQINPGGGVGATPLIITFNNKVTPAVAQQLLRSLKLSTPGSTTPGVRIPSIRISDGTSGFSPTVNRPYVQIS